MKIDLPIKNGITIPAQEIEITVSRAGGPGGQHVNKTESRVTIRWNVKASNTLTDLQKDRIIQNLQSRLSPNGDLLVTNSESRSQQTNKEKALSNLALIIRKALYVPKKRMATSVPKSVKVARLQAKARHSLIKKLRSKKISQD